MHSPVSIIGCGFIGKLLARQLSAQNIPITGYVSSKESLNECESQQIPCQVIDLDKPLDELNLIGQRVIYLAPPPRNGKSDTRMTHFIESLTTHRPEKFIYISTTSVYGDCAGEWIDESAPVNPQADRAYRRIDAETQLQTFCNAKQIPVTILRVAGIYGPDKLPIARIRSGQPIVNKEDSPYTNRIHALDLVSICESALTNTKVSGIYNVTDGNPSTMYDYFMQVADALKLPHPPAISLSIAKEQLSEGMLSYMGESRRISNKPLLEAFNIELKYPSLSEGLKDLSL